MTTQEKFERNLLIARLADEGRADAEIAADMGLSVQQVARIVAAFRAGGVDGLRPGKSTGRTPLYVPTETELTELKTLYVKTNRARGRGSKTLAARMYAQSERCSPGLREAIMKPRASKHTITKTIRDCMDVAPQIVEQHRHPKNRALSGMYCPGTLRMARDEESGVHRRLYAGERQSWDDASINFVVTVPWPWGGDKCSDKFGVRVGRFQLLAGLDDGSDFCPGFSFIIRAMQSYNKRDVVGAMFRVWRDDVVPAEAVLEGGSWQAHMTRDFVRSMGVELIDAKGRPHQKLVENYWNRLWSVLSVENGQIGRYRGEMQRENELLTRAQKGTLDPRECFVSLERALGSIETGMGYLNGEPVESRKYGTWIPCERYLADLAAHPRPALDEGLAWRARPEQHVRKVARNMVAARAACPLGMPFTYHFAAEELCEFAGCAVRVYFDPWAPSVEAVVTLEQAERGLPAGHVITRHAACLDDSPAIIEAMAAGGYAVDFDTGALSRAIEIRRAINATVRTEYRKLGLRGPRVVESDVRSAAEGGEPRITRAGMMEENGPRITRTTRMGTMGDRKHGGRIRTALELVDA